VTFAPSGLVKAASFVVRSSLGLIEPEACDSGSIWMISPVLTIT
jgi:hypothetical protein